MALSRLRHHIGKWLVIRVRMLPADAPVALLRERFVEGVLRTRTGPDGTDDVWTLWGRLRPAVLDGDPDIEVIQTQLDALRGVDLTGPEGEVRRGIAITMQVQAATSRLMTRLDARRDEFEDVWEAMAGMRVVAVGAAAAPRAVG